MDPQKLQKDVNALRQRLVDAEARVMLCMLVLPKLIAKLPVEDRTEIRSRVEDALAVSLALRATDASLPSVPTRAAELVEGMFSNQEEGDEKA